MGRVRILFIGAVALTHLNCAKQTETQSASQGNSRVVGLSAKPCIIQSAGSPSEGTSLNGLNVKNRFFKGALGPRGLLQACTRMLQTLGTHQCSRIFLGGHWGDTGEGVSDLFYLFPVDEESDSLASQVVYGKDRARQSIFSQRGPCAPGPIGNVQPVTEEAGNASDEFYVRQPTTSENQAFSEVLNCFTQLIDDSPERAIVFSSCGPYDNVQGQAEVKRALAGQKLCGQTLAEAVGIPVIYSYGTVFSADVQGQYHVTEHGSARLTPSYQR